MAEAIAEARKASHHPTVGAVVVKDNNIIGRGHRHIERLRDEPPLWRITHAEQSALKNVEEDPNGATLYVTLEPCAWRYRGQSVETAEVCSVLIPPTGISVVVIGLVDQDPMTKGKGIRYLSEAGIRVEYANSRLEPQLIDLIGDGRFGECRREYFGSLRHWLSKWRAGN